jgi:hypothetical protein
MQKEKVKKRNPLDSFIFAPNPLLKGFTFAIGHQDLWVTIIFFYKSIYNFLIYDSVIILFVVSPIWSIDFIVCT